jgi:hypothetical protein
VSSQGHAGQLSILARLTFLWHPSVVYVNRVFEACHSSLFPSPTILLSSPQFLTFPLMPLVLPTSASSNFQLIFDNALKTYKKRTRNDLPTHPLAGRFEACDSASGFLSVLQEHVQELNLSQSINTKWLDPTVNVLHTFSETLGESVGSVCFRTELVRDLPSHIFSRYSHLQRRFLSGLVSYF